MKSFIEYITEDYYSVPAKGLPPEPGTATLPKDHVRLYHQTSAENLPSIEREGLRFDKARGIEGPKGIWASEPYLSHRSGEGSGFYGSPDSTPTIEFSMHKDEWKQHFPAIQRDIKPSEILAIHHPFHRHVRYLVDNDRIDDVKNGKLDNLNDIPEYKKAFDHIKKHY